MSMTAPMIWDLASCHGGVPVQESVVSTILWRYQTAAAPPTISASSLVIAACRLVVDQLQVADQLAGASEAAFIATMRAAISQATFSTAPR